MISQQTFQNIQQAKFQDIQLEPPHDRQVLCGAINENICVTGSADHGLRVFSSQSGKFQRELFAKKYGHQEWVTSVQIMKDGRIISGGMEGFLCLWAKSGVRCDFLKGHETSITKILSDEKNVAISGSYDYTLRIWAIDRIKKNQSKASGIMVGPHKAPILDFDWKNSLCVSGDRNGMIGYWDINKTEIVKKGKSHVGGVNKICILDNINVNVVASGGLKDGTLKIFDLRSNKMIFKQQLHGGSISNICLNNNDQLVTGGADKNVCVLDLKNLGKEEKRIQVSEGVMDIQLVNNIVLCGLRDGNLVALNIDTSKAEYGFGAMREGSIVKLVFSKDYSNLLVCGDDPTSLLLKFQLISLYNGGQFNNKSKILRLIKGFNSQTFS